MTEKNKYANWVAVINEGITTAEVEVEGSSSSTKYLVKVSKNLAEHLGASTTVVISRDNSDEASSLFFAKVVEVHDEVQIAPDSEKRYPWVVSAVDFNTLYDCVKHERINVDMIIQKRREQLKQVILRENGLDGIKLISQ